MATLWRVGWSIRSALVWQDDTGRLIDLLADPPVVVRNLMRQSVRRWRLAQLIMDVLPIAALVRRVENTAGEVTILLATHVVDMAPVYAKLLRATAKNSHTMEGTQWDHKQAAALVSAMAGTQTCQYKVAALADKSNPSLNVSPMCCLCGALPGTSDICGRPLQNRECGLAIPCQGDC